MTKETQKDVNEQEFDFIINQNNATNNEPQKKGLDKKIVIIIILIVITIFTLIISALITSERNVKKESKIKFIEVKTRQELTDSFIENITNNNIDKALIDLSSSLKLNNKQLESQIQDFWGRIKLNTCTAITEQQTDENTILYSCQHDTGNMIRIRFTISDEASGLKISKYTVWVYKGVGA